MPPAPQPEAAPFGATWYGTEGLWTVLPRDGVLLGRRHKVFWWSTGWEWRRDHRPRLTVTARQIDAQGESAAASRATNAHAADIGHAMLVGLTFPAPGCWQVTADYGGRSLSFVAWVR